MKGGWIAFDLDGTLAHYDHWRGIEHIGEPIPAMIETVRAYLKEGREVRIFTARVCEGQDGYEIEDIERVIQDWTEEHIGARLPVTNQKDFGMIVLYDDRCISVEKNTGQITSLTKGRPTP